MEIRKANEMNKAGGWRYDFKQLCQIAGDVSSHSGSTIYEEEVEAVLAYLEANGVFKSVEQDE